VFERRARIVVQNSSSLWFWKLQKVDLLCIGRFLKGKRVGLDLILLVGEVLRTNEFQVWFLSEHLVEVPLVKAKPSLTET
jgi:hypothetical protein